MIRHVCNFSSHSWLPQFIKRISKIKRYPNLQSSVHGSSRLFRFIKRNLKIKTLKRQQLVPRCLSETLVLPLTITTLLRHPVETPLHCNSIVWGKYQLEALVELLHVFNSPICYTQTSDPRKTCCLGLITESHLFSIKF